MLAVLERGDRDPLVALVRLRRIAGAVVEGGDARRLQRGGVLERSRVVMLTARASEQDVLTALSLGARDHMTKPFSVAVLLQKLRAALGDEE